MRTVWSECAAGAEDVLAFYPRPPEALFDERPASRPWEPALAGALRDYQANLGLTRNFQGDEPVVITGQQPALFTGPLYTIYKAVTTAGLARSLSERHGTRVLPVYWVGSEDHDFEEARSVHVLTRDHEHMALRYTPRAAVDNAPMYRVPLEPQLHEFVDEIYAAVPGSEYAGEVAAFLHESLDTSASLADWTARIMARLFHDTELVFFAPHIEAARQAAAPVIEQEIRNPLESTRLINQTALELERIGCEPQLVKNENECNFFIEMGHRRRKVIYEHGAFVIPDEDLRCSEADLLEMLEGDPERFSPNVALRCVVQQALFPAAAYVAGPGELAYWAQLKPVFERFDQPMPAVYPRAQAVLTTVKLNKLLAKTGLTIADLTSPPNQLTDKALRNSAKHPAYLFTRRQRETLEAQLEELTEGLHQHHQNAAGMARSLAEHVASQLDRIERAIVQEDDAKKEAARQQVERLVTSLAPNRKPQERVYSVVSFLFEYGWDLVPWLIEHLDTAPFANNQLEL